MTTASPSDVRPASQPLRVPSDETVWKRYSAHHEAPLSFVGSAALHALAVALLVVWGFLVYLWFQSEAKPLRIETIHMPGGGGLTKNGDGEPGGAALPGGEPGQGEAMIVDPQLVKRPPLE